MANYCIIGYLDTFVKPNSEGGWALNVTIKSWITANLELSHVEVYDLIQASELGEPVKALEPEHIKTIMDWMVAHGEIGHPETQTITYIPEA